MYPTERVFPLSVLYPLSCPMLFNWVYQASPPQRNVPFAVIEFAVIRLVAIVPAVRSQ